MVEIEELRSFTRSLGIDLIGVADLTSLTGMPLGLSAGGATFLDEYPRAIVLGVQHGKLGKKAKGGDVSIFLEQAALQVLNSIVGRGNQGFIIHTDDEYNPVARYGLMSLKVLAKAAGLGWQGRSLLIISPEYGPIHRWIAILTDMELPAGQPISNQCAACSLCVEKCPQHALTYTLFDDHPESREAVLDVAACKGDDGCKVCMVVCPWMP